MENVFDVCILPNKNWLENLEMGPSSPNFLLRRMVLLESQYLKFGDAPNKCLYSSGLFGKFPGKCMLVQPFNNS